MIWYDQTYHYSLSIRGLKKPITKTFLSRAEANQYMYDTLAKQGLAIESVWDDHHDKTYNCSHEVQCVVSRY